MRLTIPRKENKNIEFKDNLEAKMSIKFREMKIEKELKKIVEELKKIKAVKCVYLFGSYAVRKQLPFSDIDICVIADKISKKEEGKILSLASKKVQISLFNELPIYIKFKVLKEGKLLFNKDEEFLHKIVFSTVKEYLDFRPLLKRFERFYFVRK
jgi:predicted nucleotidyltransferase